MIWYGRAFAIAGAVAATWALGAQSANAQSVFCPAGGGFVLTSGLCTNGATGAFSSAALSSQVIGEIQQSTAQQATTAALDAISARRVAETELCPDGMVRINGACHRSRTVDTAAPKGRRRSTAAPSKVVTTHPSPAIDHTSFAIWGQGFGDYERRNENPLGTIGGIAGGGGGGVQSLTLALKQRATTAGGLVGADWTRRSFFSTNDILITGLLVGYTSTDISLRATSAPVSPIVDATVSSGNSVSSVRISGPSVGAFYTYANGAFSNDSTFKVDFLDVTESFTETLGFNNGAAPVTISGAASTRLTNYTIASNFQYRFPLSQQLWFEPTGGFRYIASRYASDAATLGLESGHVWRLQAGVRWGAEAMWNTVRVTTTITGLAYSDVDVAGGPISGGAAGGSFVGTTILASDEGKVRGQGILLNTFDFGNGYSAFAQGEVRGGSGLFGIGGRGGVRVQF